MYPRVHIFTSSYRDQNGLTLEALNGGGGGVWVKLTLIGFLALNFCCFTDFQKLWYNCSLFVSTCFDAN